MMIAVALVIDGIQLILDLLIIGLLIAPFINAATALIFGIWFSHYGVRFLSGRRAWASWSAMLVEFVPGLNAIPTWTAFTIYSAVMNRASENEEDESAV